MGETVGPVDFEFALNSGMIQSEFKRVNAGLKGITQQAAEEARQMREYYRNAAAAIGAYFTFDFAKEFIGDVATITGEFQKYQAVLENSLGSTTKAVDAMNMLKLFAATTPFQLNELTGAYVKLVNQGFVPTYQQMVKLGDLASSTGKGFDQLAEAIIDAQTGEFERLKEFGIRASKSGDEVTFSFKGVETQVSYTNDAIRNYITSLGTLEGVAGSNAKISETMAGEISNLKDKWEAMLNEIGQSNNDVMSGGIALSAKAIEHYKDFIAVLKVLVATYGAYKAGVMATYAIQNAGSIMANVRAWMQLAATVRSAKDAQIAFNLATSANPIGAVAAGIALVVSSLYIYSQRQKEATQEMSLHAKTQAEFAEKLKDEQSEMDKLVAIAKNEKASREDRRKALDKLKESAGGYLDKLTLENIGHKDGADLLKKYNDQLERKYRIEANEAEIKALYGTLRTQTKGIALSETIYNNAKSKDQGEFGGQTLMVMKKRLDDLKAKAQQTREEIDKLLSDNVEASTPTKSTNTPIDKKALEKAEKLKEQMQDALEKEVWSMDEVWQKERDKGIEKLIDSIIDSDTKSMDEFAKKEEELANKFTEVYNKSMTYDQKIDTVTREYNEQIAMMREKGFEQNAKNLEKMRDKEVADIKQSQIEEIGDWKYLFENIDRLSIASLRLRIERLKEYNDKVAESDKEQQKTKQAIADAENELISKSSLDAIKILTKRIADAKDALAKARTLKEREIAQTDLDNARYDKAKVLSEMFGNVAGHLSNIAGIAGKFNEELGEAISLASNLSGAMSQIMQGNYAGGIISGVSSIVTYVMNANARRAQESEEERQIRAEELKKQLDAINRLYEIQSKLLENALGIDRIAQSITLWNTARKSIDDVIGKLDKLNNIKTKNGKQVYNKGQVYFDLFQMGDVLQEADSRRGTPEVKITTLDQMLAANAEKIKRFQEDIAAGKISGENFDEIQNLISEYEKYASALEEIANKQKEILTGSTYDSVVDGLAKAFEDGIVSAEEFTSSFGDLMEKEVMNTLKLQYLEKPMKDWYGKFAEASKDGLTKDEIDALRADYMKYAEDAKAGFESLNEIMKDAGVDIFGTATSTKENSMVGQIKAQLTEETGSILAGQASGLRYDVKDIFQLNKRQLETLGNIETNTFLTATRLNKLDDVINKLDAINGKMGSSSINDLRAIGK